MIVYNIIAMLIGIKNWTNLFIYYQYIVYALHVQSAGLYRTIDRPIEWLYFISNVEPRGIMPSRPFYSLLRDRPNKRGSVVGFDAVFKISEVVRYRKPVGVLVKHLLSGLYLVP